MKKQLLFRGRFMTLGDLLNRASEYLSERNVEDPL